MWLALHDSDNLGIHESMWTMYLQEINLEKEDVL